MTTTTRTAAAPPLVVGAGSPPSKPPSAPTEVAGRPVQRVLHPDRAGPTAPTTPPATGDADRSLLAAAVPTLGDVSFDVGHAGLNALIVLLVLFLVGLPAEMLNSVLKARHAERTPSPRLARLAGIGTAINSLPNGLLLIGFALVGAGIYSQLDPDFGWDRRSAIAVAGLSTALIVVTGFAEALRIPFIRRRGGPSSHLRVFPLALVAAIVLVVLSRGLGLRPGLIFGITCGLAMAGELDDIDEGRSIAVASGALLAVTLASWLAWGPVASAASGPDPGTATLFLDAALSTVWVSGLQAVLFGLLPLTFLAGERVLRWSRSGWIALYATALFLFVDAVLRPGSGATETTSATAWSMVGLLALFCLASVGAWLWYRHVVRRQAPEAAP